MAAEVFVSYGRKDRDKVLPWVERLRDAGVSLWIDEAAIEGASLWSQEIVNALEQCKVCLLMLSQSSAESEHVAREVALASEDGKPILPLLLEPVTIPRALRYPLAGIQRIELSGGESAEKLQAIVRALGECGVTIQAPSTTEDRDGVTVHLPRQLTRFIGREQEIAAVRRLLSAAQLLTLTGPGGCGKTRLSLQVAAEAQEAFEDGVYFVDLAPITDANLVPSMIAQVLGVQEEATRPLIESLKQSLRAKQALLVLDNLEHVLPAAPQVAGLLAACPDLKILATSREVLRITGEREFPVPSLPIPTTDHRPPTTGEGPRSTISPSRHPTTSPPHHLTPEHLVQFASVQLFVDRAAAARSEFRITDENAAAVAEICACLDGLPLAIELAAARIKLLSPQQMLARLVRRVGGPTGGVGAVREPPLPRGPASPLQFLTGGARDVPERRRTLRGAIDWSHDLLSPQEQMLFRRLSIFAGGWTLEAAEAVCTGRGIGCWVLGIGNDPSAPTPNTQYPTPLEIDVLDGLSSLVDKSLVRQEEHGEGEPRFTMLAILREYGRERLEESWELEAIRRAHAACYLALAEDAAPRLRGPEQAAWFARLEIDHDDLWAVLDGSVSAGDVETGLRLGAALWRFWDVRGYLWEGRARLEALLAMPEAAARTAVRARALNAAGALAQDQSDFRGAAALHAESLEIARECGDTESMANALNLLGNVALEQGVDEAATKRYEESLVLWRDLGDKNGIAMALHNLGSVARDRGDYETAARYLDESLTFKRQIGDQKAIALTLNNLGMVAMAQRAYERAAALLNESLRLFQQIGDNYRIAGALSNLAELVAAQGNLPRAMALQRECLHYCSKLDNKQEIARCFERLAVVLAALGRPLAAAPLYGAAEALREAVGSPLPDSDRADYDRSIAAAQAAVEPGDWEAAWAHGRAMAVPQAIAFAMEASVPRSDEG